MQKKPFVNLDKLNEIISEYPTPFHLYDEAGIRATAKAVNNAFSWNPGFREYFAVKAAPNPHLMKLLKEFDFGSDCSSMAVSTAQVSQSNPYLALSYPISLIVSLTTLGIST